jgi:molecular chaperone GrpE
MSDTSSDPAASPASDADALTALQAELTQAKAMIAELERFRDTAARAQADLQNAKARLERDREELGKFAVEGLLRRLLGAVDNFRRAESHLPETLKADAWAQGVLAVGQELAKVLGESGLKRMEPLGQVADPNQHEILGVGPGAEGVVVDVLEDGYELHGRVLRAAKVRVGDGSQTVA